MRLKSWDYTRSWWYYVTICVHGSGIPLGTIERETMVLSRFGEAAKDASLWLTRHHYWVELDDFIIMPDHFHGIVILTSSRGGSRRRSANGGNRPYNCWESHCCPGLPK